MIDLTQFWQDNPQLAAAKKEFAVFAINYAPLAVSTAPQQGDLTTSTDSCFVITNIYGSQANTTNTAFITTPLILSLVYTSKLRNVTSLPLEWTSITGTTLNPRVFWPYPIVIPPASQMSTFVTNPQAAASNVFIAFHGIKCFTGRQ